MAVNENEHETIAILDAGSQYGKLIDRRIRELRVRTELLPLSVSAAQIKSANYRAIIISGGPDSVYSATAPKYDPELFHLGVPILGICYGLQLLARDLAGAQVAPKEYLRNDGQQDITVDLESPLFQELSGANQKVLLTHGDIVNELRASHDDDWKVIATGKQGLIVGIGSQKRRIYGLQFHPEVDLTVEGTSIFRNFLFKVAGLSGDYTIEDREAKAIKEINDIVGESKKVLALVSGGVDSSVCVALLNKAIGPERVFAIHIDNGFMREGESKLVKASLEALGIKLQVVDAGPIFFQARLDNISVLRLCETTDPETKRKIIGDTFMRVAEEEIRKLGLKAEDVFLAQGTLRPDLIESASHLASSVADAIKTHHNDTNLVRELRLKGRVVEPLKDYHKDEVRVLGESLGLPHSLVWRTPFPGPGLAIRILCTTEPFYHGKYDHSNALLNYLLAGDAGDLTDDARAGADSLLVAREIDIGALREKGLRGRLLPVKTVGVQGDGRSYNHLAVLYSSQVGNGVEKASDVDWNLLTSLGKTIPALCKNVNRVVYAFGGVGQVIVKKITPTHLTSDAIQQLQRADSAVNKILTKFKLFERGRLSQVPVILVPIEFDPDQSTEPGEPVYNGVTHRSIAIRPFLTNDFMTGVAATPGTDLPLECIDELVGAVRQDPSISRVLYDITSKPPATTEWE
eukprot:TRINITY_DN13320_c0_g1_i1.p1 TRINITY_DN13320_c0_g1~~TRINITY_DN13320_c0_g1_i1.p1  ORF type:complete len:704 (-),score=143.31 TRINITY_DN13320_c0_g1_i1:10-2076(-)